MFIITTSKSKNHIKNIPMIGNLDVINRSVDCYNHTSFCFDDRECLNKCINIDVVCRAGVCMSAKEMDKQIKDNPCNPKLGIYGLLVGDPQLGTLKIICKSVDLGVAENDGSNNMCKNGTIDINYNVKNPTFRDCVCEKDTKRVVIPATKMIRSLGACVHPNMATYLNEEF